ncbi:MAG: hypothetical protein HY235_08620 [Acidobacteria bacterium]|nr:hypothetical protein [Acidobacteriota bacterium]
MRTWFTIAALLMTAVALLTVGGFPPQGAQAQAAANPVTLLLWFGVKATAEERWDGTAIVSGGKLLSITGRHFSEGDQELGENKWRAATRRDAVPPYADLHYTEMRPGSAPEVRHQPLGVYLHLDAPPPARVKVETAQGNFEFGLNDLGLEPIAFLEGKALAMRVPTAEKLTGGESEDDEPSIAALADGGIAAAWVAYRGQADRLLLRTRKGDAWTAAEEVTGKPGDIFRSSIAAAPDGTLWVFWSEREGSRWFLWGRARRGGSWLKPERISDAGSATFHRATAAGNGTVYVVWQSFRDGQSDIYLRAFAGGRWQPEVRLSESKANDWEPAVAAAADGAAHVAWDSYDQGHYDIHYRSYQDGRAGDLVRITSGPRFQAHAAVAVDGQGRPWIAWNESGVNWAKDQGFLIPTPLATPLHQERWLKIAFRDGGQWQEPWPLIEDSLLPAMKRNAEHPQLIFGPGGALVVAFRHWTRRVSRSIGSPIVWENYITSYNGRQWAYPKPLPMSGGWIEKHPALAVDTRGDLWAAWMTDNRPFATMVPQNSDVYAGKLDRPGPLAGGQVSKRAYVEPFEEAIPVHTNDAGDVNAIRGYAIESEGKRYRIFRGDMHRHTDISQDFKYDGSLFEVYRYGLDAAAFDYIAPTDHQTGYDQEFSWWQNQKYVDLFLVPNTFVPMFAYERSLRYPNGHRNIVWARRGVRTLPIPPEEASGQEGARKLYEYLRQSGGISMPHSSATDQGTNWRDNDPQVEPLIEIYQGYRASYEYEGAPRAATALNQHVQKSGWQPSGFWWHALAKGYKLGVQASSDHWSTHISYACLLVEGATREQLLDAIRKRHAYAATDNIILDFRARAGGREYIMGDAFEGPAAPQLTVHVKGTNQIKQIDVVRDQQFIYTSRPQGSASANEVRFTFTDANKGAGESWYYVRVLQEDGQLAWSSPIWIKR